ncbi:hypothetical protein AAFF_G00038740 [Aldrovandia affinis]|uniref:Uncharacterized protein n=1 Tax=Aldrovandia affinis TaxID=143900 RepID=A0AAD7WZ83_9TELE|nr:hypothetical protein AAFF_G00038740 [Aldrovandia affinis]
MAIARMQRTAISVSRRCRDLAASRIAGHNWWAASGPETSCHARIPPQMNAPDGALLARLRHDSGSKAPAPRQKWRNIGFPFTVVSFPLFSTSSTG